MMAEDALAPWSELQLQRIREWIGDRNVADKRCTLCHVGRLVVADTPANILVGTPSGDNISGANYPCIALVCNHCGHMVLINAIVAGLQLPDSERAANCPGNSISSTTP
jgi:hypothetical protein